jgi:hypothetical protein
MADNKGIAKTGLVAQEMRIKHVTGSDLWDQALSGKLR